MRMFAPYDVAEAVNENDARNNEERPSAENRGAFLFAELTVGGYSTGSRFRKMWRPVRCQKPSWMYWLSL